MRRHSRWIQEINDGSCPRTFQRMGGKSGGTTGTDDDFAARFGEGIGAWIMGRYMFGPIRGSWPDDAWRGWWGKNPPYHGPVYVLTHHARPPVETEGGTVFHFVTDGPHEALERAMAAAAGKDVEIGGGVATIRQYLAAGLIDELHVAIAPRLLGSVNISSMDSTSWPGLQVHHACADRRCHTHRAHKGQ